MIKHFFSVLIFIFFFIFIFFVVSTYISNTNREKVIKNRTNIYSKIKEKIIVLPLLKNNTKFSYEIEILYITLTHIYCSRSIAALGLSLCRVRCDYFSTRLVTRQLYRDIVERPNYCMSIFSSIPLG